MRGLAVWLRRRAGMRWPAGIALARQGAGSTRAEVIDVLRAEIARLQQERLAWDKVGPGATTGATQRESDRHLAAIEQRLNDAQREIAKYQGRI